MEVILFYLIGKINMNKPNKINSLSKLNKSPWYKIKSPLGAEEYLPKILDINPNYFQKDENKLRFYLSVTYLLKINLFFY